MKNDLVNAIDAAAEEIRAVDNRGGLGIDVHPRLRTALACLDKAKKLAIAEPERAERAAQHEFVLQLVKEVVVTAAERTFRNGGLDAAAFRRSVKLTDRQRRALQVFAGWGERVIRVALDEAVKEPETFTTELTIPAISWTLAFFFVLVVLRAILEP